MPKAELGRDGFARPRAELGRTDDFAALAVPLRPIPREDAGLSRFPDARSNFTLSGVVLPLEGIADADLRCMINTAVSNDVWPLCGFQISRDWMKKASSLWIWEDCIMTAMAWISRVHRDIADSRCLIFPLISAVAGKRVASLPQKAQPGHYAHAV